MLGWLQDSLALACFERSSHRLPCPIQQERAMPYRTNAPPPIETGPRWGVARWVRVFVRIRRVMGIALWYADNFDLIGWELIRPLPPRRRL